MKKILISAAVMALAFSCVYPYEPTLDEKDLSHIVVIEGNVIVGGQSSVRFSQVLPITNNYEQWYGSFRDIAGMAFIEDEQGKVYMPVQPRGTTFTFNTQDASPDLKYRLRAEIANDVYVSDWTEPIAPPVIEDVSFSCDNTNVHVAVTLDGGEESSGFVGISYDENWEFHADFACEYLLDTLNWDLIDVVKSGQEYPNYWCWQKASMNGMILLDISEMQGGKAVDAPLFQFPRTNSRNHRKYCVTLHARTLPKEAYRYLKNMDDITKSGRSLFTPNPGDMSSNISCESNPDRRVLGYVNVMRETSFRGWMDDRFKKDRTPYYGEFFLPPGKMAFKSNYYSGNYPVAELTLPDPMTGDPVTGIYWAPRRCIDCVLEGGTKNKPDFWE